ncbi:DNA polymerase I [Buchnera aphidicola (Neophyllaphis podocarpi)]
MISKKILILIDGSYYLYRSYYALKNLKNEKGEQSGAIYGVINLIINLIKKYKTKNIAIIFDYKKKNFRNKIFAEYKANRKIMPENLKNQIAPLIKIIKAIGIPFISIKNVESDDVIGTLCKQAEKDNRKVIIVTSDKDMAQLVTKNINIINDNIDYIMGIKEIKKKYGVYPKNIIDLLALTGDKSDNIPGIKGIGPKTAIKLIEEIGDLTLIYKNLKKILTIKIRGAKNIIKKLNKDKKNALISYKLVKIKLNVKLQISLENIKIKNTKIKTVLNLFKYYNFNKWIKQIELNTWNLKTDNKLNIDKKEKKNKIKQKFVYLNKENLENNINIINNYSMISIYFEIKDIKNVCNNINIRNIFISTSKKTTYIINIEEIHQINNKKTFDKNYIFLKLKNILENNLINKIHYNLKLNLIIFKKYNIKLRGKNFDIILESYLLKNTIKNHDKIEILTEKWIQLKNNTYSNIKNKITKNIIEENQKSIIIFMLHVIMYKKIKKNKKIKNLLLNLDIPLLKVILRIEKNGVLINKNVLIKHAEKIKIRLKEINKKVKTLTGKNFNILSTNQLKNILFNDEQKKKLSTSKLTLKNLFKNNPLITLILEYRKLYKIKSVYCDNLIKLINNITKRIHTCYNQVKTTTGRLTSTNPNLQNIPIKSKEGKIVRQAFISNKNNILVSVDYSQIELRIIAHFSKDKKLLLYFKKNKDIHIETAKKIFNIKSTEITKDQRQIAKTINFALIYGMKPFGLSKILNINIIEAENYIKIFFKKYKGVYNYIKQNLEFAKKNKYVLTLFGRILHVKDINSLNNNKKKSSERLAINGPIQGTVADIIKYSMIKIDQWINKNKIQKNIKMIMQIHDELIFEINKNNIYKYCEKIKKIMENNKKLTVPININIKTGKNLLEMKLIKILK